MPDNQLTCDAVVNPGFDGGLLATVGAEMRFVRAPARAGRIDHRVFTAVKPA